MKLALENDLEFKPQGSPVFGAPKFVSLCEKVRPLVKPVPAVGSLRITSDPSVADVFLDSKKVGETPIALDDLPEKSYHVRLEKQGFHVKEGVVKVTSGQTTTFNGQLPAVIVHEKQPKNGPEKKPTGQGRSYRIAGWTLFGVSLASFATSGVFYARAMDFAGQTSSAADKSKYDNYKSSAETAQYMSWGFGGLGVVSGGICVGLLVKGYKSRSRYSSLTNSPIVLLNMDINKERAGLGFGLIW